MDKNKTHKILTITYESIPTRANINYVFQKLVTSIIASTGFDLYEESHQEFKQILNTVMKWIVDYVNTENLNSIDFNEFIIIRQQLFELDSKYLPIDGRYAEEAYEWALQLQVLLEKSYKERRNYENR